jgi:phosphatidylglycerophosphate synthase
MNHLPFLLTTLRLCSSALFFICDESRWLAGVLTLGLLTDIFDGVIARRLGVATDRLRRYDSFADTVFYLAVLVGAWRLFPDVILAHAVGIGLVAAMEAGRFVFDYLKFRREASYHFYSAKLWGLSLFIGFFLLFAFSNSGGLWLAIAFGLIPQVEGFAASLITPVWVRDVPSVFHVWALRRAANRA